MLNKPKRNSKASIAIIKSKNTDILYIGMIIDGQPYKVWKLDDFSPAGIDFCNQLMKAYDLGYEIECQLPVISNNQRQIVPCIYNLNDSVEENKTPLQEKIEKIIPPPNIKQFDSYEKEDAVLADQCGINDEYLDEAKKNIEDNPEKVAFTEFIPDEMEEIDTADVPPAPTEDEFFADSQNDTTIEEVLAEKNALRDADNNIIEEEDIEQDLFPPMPKSKPSIPPLPAELSKADNTPRLEETTTSTSTDTAAHKTEKPAAIAKTPIAEDTWLCSCGATNTAKFCKECGLPKPAPKNDTINDTTWVCSCGAVNTSKFCMECGKHKPEPVNDIKTWECPVCHTVNTSKFCCGCGLKQGNSIPGQSAESEVKSTPVVESKSPLIVEQVSADDDMLPPSTSPQQIKATSTNSENSVKNEVDVSPEPPSEPQKEEEIKEDVKTEEESSSDDNFFSEFLNMYKSKRS